MSDEPTTADTIREHLTTIIAAPSRRATQERRKARTGLPVKREHIEALARALAPDAWDDNSDGLKSDLRRAAHLALSDRVFAAIASDPAAQDAVLAALVEGGRLVEESANSPTATPISFDRVRFMGGEDGCEAIVYAASQTLTITRKVRLVEPEWREATP